VITRSNPSRCLCLHSVVQGKGDAEDVRGRDQVEGDRTVVSFGDSSGDGQAEAGAELIAIGFVGSEEIIVGAIEGFAGIGDQDLKGDNGCVWATFDAQPAGLRADAIQAIKDHVTHHFGESRRIEHDRFGRGIEPQVKADVARRKDGGEGFGGGDDQRGRIGRGKLERTRAAIVEHVEGEFLHSLEVGPEDVPATLDAVDVFVLEGIVDDLAGSADHLEDVLYGMRHFLGGQARFGHRRSVAGLAEEAAVIPHQGQKTGGQFENGQVAFIPRAPIAGVGVDGAEPSAGQRQRHAQDGDDVEPLELRVGREGGVKAGVVEEDRLAVAEDGGEDRFAGGIERRITVRGMGGADRTNLSGVTEYDVDIVGVQTLADPFGRGNKIVLFDACGIEAAKRHEPIERGRAMRRGSRADRLQGRVEPYCRFSHVGFSVPFRDCHRIYRTEDGLT
jgi:hypothetical protein